MEHNIPDSKVLGANMGPIWDRKDQGGSHVGPMNFAIWDRLQIRETGVGIICRCIHNAHTFHSLNEVVSEQKDNYCCWYWITVK